MRKYSNLEALIAVLLPHNSYSARSENEFINNGLDAVDPARWPHIESELRDFLLEKLDDYQLGTFWYRQNKYIGFESADALRAFFRAIHAQVKLRVP